MPRKTTWVIRVIIPTDMEAAGDYFGADHPRHNFGEFLEQLRRCGLLYVHDRGENKYIFDILPPHGVDSETWAGMNADRMQSFGYNAVKAPEWKP